MIGLSIGGSVFGIITTAVNPPATAARLHRLQGYWEGEGPPGRISIRAANVAPAA